MEMTEESGKLKTESIETEQSKEKRLKKINSLRIQWDNKSSNICVTGVQEGEEKKVQLGKIFEEIMPLNFLNLGKDINRQIQEAEWILRRLKPKKSTTSHIIKLLKTKNKEKNLDSSQREMTYYLKGNNNSNDSRFLIRNHGVRKKWHIFQVMKEKNFSSEFYLQLKYSSRMKVKKQTKKWTKPKQKEQRWRTVSMKED